MKKPSIATKPAQEIEAFQYQKLKETLQYVSENSPFYRALFAKNNIEIDEIDSLAALRKIP